MAARLARARERARKLHGRTPKVLNLAAPESMFGLAGSVLLLVSAALDESSGIVVGAAAFALGAAAYFLIRMRR